MATSTIMVIRHAEKPKVNPGEPDLGLGVSEMGEEDKHSLVVRGWQRAGAWAVLFGSGAFGPDYPKPGAVFAANPVAPPKADGSVSERPCNTILPLCRRLNITPVRQFGVGDETPMLEAVKALSGVVLISWEHKKIQDVIAPALGHNVQWGGTRFDVVLRFDRAPGGTNWNIRQLFPQLLAGDSNVPLPTSS
jgi:hypothetical protein